MKFEYRQNYYMMREVSTVTMFSGGFDFFRGLEMFFILIWVVVTLVYTHVKFYHRL